MIDIIPDSMGFSMIDFNYNLCPTQFVHQMISNLSAYKLYRLVNASIIIFLDQLIGDGEEEGQAGTNRKRRHATRHFQEEESGLAEEG